MIRQALIAVGVSLGAAGALLFGAGVARAQGMVATAPILAACGGERLVLAANDVVDPAELESARDIVNARVGGVFTQVFNYTSVDNDQIIVSVPQALFLTDTTARDAIAPLLNRVEFGFYEVDFLIEAGDSKVLLDGQLRLPMRDDPSRDVIIDAVPILDGSVVARAAPIFDHNNTPAVSFAFNDEGAAIFGQYTSDNIGAPFAIVLDGAVMSAPTIMSPILGGEGMVTGSFTVDEVNALAAVLQGGVLPFDLNVVAEQRVDGSDPSADFCP